MSHQCTNPCDCQSSPSLPWCWRGHQGPDRLSCSPRTFSGHRLEKSSLNDRCCIQCPYCCPHTHRSPNLQSRSWEMALVSVQSSLLCRGTQYRRCLSRVKIRLVPLDPIRPFFLRSICGRESIYDRLELWSRVPPTDRWDTL